MKNKRVLPSFVRSSSLWHTCRRPPVHSGVIRIQFIAFIIYSEAAVVIFQPIGLWLEALGLGAVQVHAAAHGHLRLGNRAIVLPPAGQGEAAIVGPVGAPRHVGVAGPVADAPGQAAIVVREVPVAVVADVGAVLALVALGVRVVVAVVGSGQGGGGLWGDEALPVLQVPPVDGVRVAAHGRGAVHGGEPVRPQRHLPHRPCGDCLHHLGDLAASRENVLMFSLLHNVVRHMGRWRSKTGREHHKANDCAMPVTLV